MRRPNFPASRDLVLVGGGHTHALLLRRWAMDPLPGTRVTVINPGPTAPYSGMLPGHVAGHYDRAALDIDLVQLARAAGARIVIGAATGIDLARRTVAVPDRPAVGYDIASIDVGITSRMPGLPGFADHAVPAKPLGAYADAWAAYRDGSGPASVAVIGGGVAGAELAMAMAHALRQRGRDAQVHLVERETALAALRSQAATRMRAALTAQGVTLHDRAAIGHVSDRGVHLEDGRLIVADFVTGAAGARPHDWLAQTGLGLHEGFVVIDPRLRTSDPRVFATGDCAHMPFAPRPKAGVFAVRQAPVLFSNLRAALTETGGMRRYRPQRDYLKLISLGGKSALADRFGLCLSGPLMWRWKDKIDRAFMEKFQNLPRMIAPALPWPRTAGMRAALGSKPLCGGCGSKVGRDTLMQAIGADGVPGDDAAVLQTGGATQVVSTDHLRAMVEDPVVMARIAAIHALGDVWAMGGKPQAALLSVILPRLSPALAERSLAEIAGAVRGVLDAAGASLVGGHSTHGAELTIGLSVTGLCDGAPITLAGARPGDALILTKPIGSGVIMAAEMQGRARGEWVAEALRWMTQSQGEAAAILGTAHAMTDVTGFGLAGHLFNLCAASRCGAALDLSAVPVMDGALALARAGFRSSLFAENRVTLLDAPDGPETELLLDPQTGGGLLAALSPAETEKVLAALQAAGYRAACIGRITDRAGQIAIV